MNFLKQTIVFMVLFFSAAIGAMNGNGTSNSRINNGQNNGTKLIINDYSFLPQKAQDTHTNRNMIEQCGELIEDMKQNQKPENMSLQQLKDTFCSFYCLSYLTPAEIEKCYRIKDLLQALVAEPSIQMAGAMIQKNLAQSISDLFQRAHAKANKEVPSSRPLLNTSAEFPSFAKAMTTNAKSAKKTEPAKEEVIACELILDQLIDACSSFLRDHAQFLMNQLRHAYEPVKELVNSHAQAYLEVKNLEKVIGDARVELQTIEASVAKQKKEKRNGNARGWTRSQRTRKAELEKSCLECEPALKQQQHVLMDIQSTIADKRRHLIAFYAELYSFVQQSTVLMQNQGCKDFGPLCGLEKEDEEMVASLLTLEPESPYKVRACRALSLFDQTEHRTCLYRTLLEYIAHAHHPKAEISISAKGISWEIALALYFHDKNMLRAWRCDKTLVGGSLSKEIDFVLMDGRFVECKNRLWNTREEFTGIKRQLQDQQKIAESHGTNVILISKYELPRNCLTNYYMLRLATIQGRNARHIEIDVIDPIFCKGFEELYKPGPYHDLSELKY